MQYKTVCILIKCIYNSGVAVPSIDVIVGLVDIPISGFDDPAVHSVSNAAETIAKLAGKEKEQKRRRKKVRKRTRRAQRDSEEATEANEAAEAAETQIYSGTESSTRHQRKCVLLKLTGQSEMAYP